MKIIDQIKHFEPCVEAVEWLGDKTFDEAWATCERGDWMLWAYARLYYDRNRELVGCVAECVATIQHLMTDQRSVDVLKACKKYANGEISKEELLSYAIASYEAAEANADINAHAAAAYQAAHAAVNVHSATYAASAAAACADSAAAYADFAAARKKNLKLTADICRRLLPCS